MQRYSLYIDHQLVSPLIRQLEDITQKCYEELDQEYQTFELRTSIYELFVFQITALYNGKYGIKGQKQELKDEQAIKFYELTTKLDGIKTDIKFQQSFYNEQKGRKGRPSKYQEVEQKFVECIKIKIKDHSQYKFQKKQLDQIYLSLMMQDKRKTLPVGSYLRIFKKFNLKQVSVLVRGGKQKSINDLIQKKSISRSFWKKQEDSSIMKSQYVSASQLQSTSQIDVHNCNQSINSSQYQFGHGNTVKDRMQLLHQKKVLRSSSANVSKKQIKYRKKKLKNLYKIFDLQSERGDNESQWQKNFSMSEQNFGQIDKKAEIYEDSRSFQ